MDTPAYETASHWNKFYRSTEAEHLILPSQFAAFVAGEAPHEAFVVDMGCGSGRDALFFASQGHSVIGVDASKSAIDHCSEMARNTNLRARFVQAEVQSPVWTLAVQSASAYQSAPALIVYARFFLHAIPEEGEDALLDAVCRIAKPGHTMLAVEFRTPRDATLPKSTACHFRRFSPPSELLAKAVERGMKIDYFVEGFGFAKYGADDAHVARCIFIL